MRGERIKIASPFKLRFAGGSMMPNNECWLGSLVIFQGIQTSIAKTLYFCGFSRRESNNLDPRMSSLFTPAFSKYSAFSTSVHCPVRLFAFEMYLKWYHKTCFSPPVKIFLLTVPRWCIFVDPFCCLCFLFVMLSCLWSPAGKGLTSWLPCM